MAVEVFVNGHPVAQQGNFPPHADVSLSAFDFVSDLAPGVVVPGQTAVVVLRAWYPPFMAATDAFATAGVDINESRNLHLAARANHLASLLSIGPDIALSFFIASMGVGLLVFWRWTRSWDWNKEGTNAQAWQGPHCAIELSRNRGQLPPREPFGPRPPSPAAPRL